MARFPRIDVLGRPGFCNVCWRPCITLDQVGIRCYHCRQGVFVHRRYWDQRECECHGAFTCALCGGCGVVAIPKEDLRPDWDQADQGG